MLVKKQKNMLGFTLAEVLITLAIIGVVAALTLPSLMSYIQIEQFRTKLKKEFSALTQVVNSLQSKNSSIDTSSTSNLIAELSSQLTETQAGTFGTLTNLPDTFSYTCYKVSSGTCGNLVKKPDVNNTPAFKTMDGALFVFRATYPNCDGTNWHSRINSSEALPQNNNCALIDIDLNGDQKPNMLGVDYHFFYLLKKNNAYYLKPNGVNNDTNCNSSLSDNYSNSLHCTHRMLLDMPMP